MCIRDSPPFSPPLNLSPSQLVFSHTLSLLHSKDKYLYNYHTPSYPLSLYTGEPNNHPPNPMEPLPSSNKNYITCTAIPPPLCLPSVTFPYSHHLDLWTCLLYTSDAADERSSVDLGGRRIIKK